MFSQMEAIILKWISGFYSSYENHYMETVYVTGFVVVGRTDLMSDFIYPDSY